MKKLYSALAVITLLALTLFTAPADNVTVIVPANTASNLVAFPIITDEITFTATTTNLTTVYIYDSANTTTNMGLGAYTRFTSYATNYSVVFTNENNILVTNSFTGRYTAPVTVASATNTLPALVTVVIPGSAQRTKVIQLQAVRGLVAVPTYGVIIEVDYRKNP